MYDDDVVEREICRLLGILGSIPEQGSTEHGIFMYWVNCHKGKLTFFHILVETFAEHGGEDLSLLRSATRALDVESVLRILKIHNRILSNMKCSNNNLFDKL